MDRLKALLADVQAWFQRLTTRERRLVAGAATGVAAFVLFFVLIGFSTSAASYRRRTEEKLVKLQDVQTLAASYREAEQNRQSMERQLTTSKLTLTDITVNRMVDFFSAVERGPGVVKVKLLRLEPRTSNQTLTVWATIATYRLK